MATAKKVVASPSAKITSRLKVLRALLDESDKLKPKLKLVQDKIEALKLELLNEFARAKMDSTTAVGLRVTKFMGTSPQLEDTDAFLRFATKKANWDLLQKSVNTPAWRERILAKKAVPGVGVFQRAGLSVTRLDKKRSAKE